MTAQLNVEWSVHKRVLNYNGTVQTVQCGTTYPRFDANSRPHRPHSRQGKAGHERSQVFDLGDGLTSSTSTLCMFFPFAMFSACSSFGHSCSSCRSFHKPARNVGPRGTSSAEGSTVFITEDELLASLRGVAVANT